MNEGYYRQPTLAGDRVVFFCEDDLWSVGLEGGAAIRLTANPGPAATPRLSPDGSRIAFIANHEGHPEVYVMPSSGGQPRRLTFLGSTRATIATWSNDGRTIYFLANPTTWYEGEQRAFAVDADGGVPIELHLGHMRAFSLGPDGRMAIGRNEADPARWKRYRGGTAGEIWADWDVRGVFTRLPLAGGNPTWPMWIGNRIYFLDDREGIGNIYSCAPSGDDVRRHTNEAEYYVRFPSTDGRTIVFSAGGRLFAHDTADDATREIAVTCASAAPQTSRKFLTATESLERFAPSPDGTSLAVIARGQPFTMPFWEEAPVHYGSGSRVRYREPAWLHDGKRFVCVTDEAGFEQLQVHGTGAHEPSRTITRGDIGRVTELAASPVDDVVAFANHRYELCFVDLKSDDVRVIDKSLGNRITDLAFSPDGRWVAYVWWPGGENRAIVRIAKVKSGKTYDVTSPLRVDRAPAWDPQGRYLYFISTRDFDPVYDALQFDLSFPQAQRPFVATLRADVPSPFVPKPKPLHRDDDRDDDRDEDRRERQRPEKIRIDFEGIQGRILAFPVDEGEFGEIVASKHRVFFTRYEMRGIKPGDRRDDDDVATLLAYDFEQQRCGIVARDVGEMHISADARTIVYRSHERLRVLDAHADLAEDEDEPQKPPSEPGRKSGWVDLERVAIEVVPRDEWAQMYREAWRLQTEQFWVEDMSDIDWDRVFDRYNALLPRVRTRTELSDVMWEMQGELGTSHAYEYGGDHREPPQYKRGFLGADFSYDERSDGWRIDRIYRGDSWNRDVDSPLAEPGLCIAAGDVLVAIGGRRLSRTFTPQAALVNAAGRDVTLTIRDADGKERLVFARALRSEDQLRYRAWVDANRSYVHERSEGKVGYVHIPDMGPWGFSEFHRGYLEEFDRGGLLVDVRYNRGGHVSPLLLEKLARKRVGYDVSRYSEKPIPYPPESVAGPLVALTNQFAGSDGDIFSHCFKLYGLGPLVGKRTWGGVIGINPYHELVDGTLTTQPEFSFWFKDVGWQVENYGTDPDVEVDIAPQDYLEGRDPQLDEALKLALDALASHHEPCPDMSARPSLALPTLP